MFFALRQINREEFTVQKKEAIKEAKRLLEKQPYREFQILEITDVFDNYGVFGVPF